MRYAASEKLEIIRTVETSHLPVRRTLDKIDKVIERALDEPELSPREVAVAFTDAEKTLSPRPASIAS